MKNDLLKHKINYECGNHCSYGCRMCSCYCRGLRRNRGYPGLQGPAGSEGPQGIQGPPGRVGPQGIQGLPGPIGPQGIQGPPGPVGPQGIQGPPGPEGQLGIQSIASIRGLQEVEGSNNSGTLIPFTSGTPLPIYMDTDQHPYTVGFGSHGQLPHPVIGGKFEVTSGLVTSFPFLIARNVVITDMGVSLMAFETVDLGTAAANMFIQLFYKTDTTYYIAIPETKVVMAPTLSGNVKKGTLFKMIANNLNVMVASGSELMLIIHKDVIQEDNTKSIVAMMSGSVHLRNI